MMEMATRLKSAALTRPIRSPKLRRPAARAESVTVKLSHERTGQCLLTSALIGEEYLGLDADGERNALAGSALQQRLGRHGAQARY